MRFVRRFARQQNVKYWPVRCANSTPSMAPHTRRFRSNWIIKSLVGIGVAPGFAVGGVFRKIENFRNSKSSLSVRGRALAVSIGNGYSARAKIAARRTNNSAPIANLFILRMKPTRLAGVKRQAKAGAFMRRRSHNQTCARITGVGSLRPHGAPGLSPGRLRRAVLMLTAMGSYGIGYICIRYAPSTASAGVGNLSLRVSSC